MGFTIWGHNFEGPFQNTYSLCNKAGVYIIWCRNRDGWKIIDVGEAEDIKESVIDPDRLNSWAKKGKGSIYYSATYTDEGKDSRRKLEHYIRSQTNPSCSAIK